MTDTKHSPLPWQTSGVRVRESGERMLQVIDGSDRVIAYVCYSDRTPKDHVQSHADQRMIVQAVNNYDDHLTTIAGFRAEVEGYAADEKACMDMLADVPGDDLTYRVEKIVSWYLDLQATISRLTEERDGIRAALYNLMSASIRRASMNHYHPEFNAAIAGLEVAERKAGELLATPPDTDAEQRGER